MAFKKKVIKKPKTVASSQALEQLVSQFAQPLAFLRELVQNSMDASTELIEVEVDYDSEAECCFVRVRDTGIGMDRHIIDTKLTRLFASTKENDLTKIGKFGIGFVSIFAIKPQLVVLETGREGESWRLLFKPDRSFERRELKTPVEGTCVTVFTTRGRDELPKLQRDCLDTVSYWCRHAEVEINFNGTLVNEPFELRDAVFSYRHQVEGTEVVVAPSLNPIGFQGYYNRGLTLLEGEGSPLPHLSFKLRSRYLEHTLSRDNVLFDESYEKAMAEVKVAAYRDMPRALLERLARSDDENLWSLARVVAKFPDPAPGAFVKAPIFPSRGRRLKLSELGSSAFYHPQVDDFWQAVEATGAAIVLAEAGDQKLELLRDLGCQTQSLESHFLYFELCSDLSDPETAFLEQLKLADKSTPRLVVIEANNVPGLWKDRFCGYVDADLRLAGEYRRGQLKGRAEIGIFREHPFWSKLVELHLAQPELAISFGMRKLSLDLDLGTKRDGALFGRLVKSLKTRAVTPA